MPFTLSPLPYEEDALAPHISARALRLHYRRHHRAYVENLNRLTAEGPQSGMSLEEIILSAAPGATFNNAAQDWNHRFFWNSMAPKGGGEPTGDLAKAIQRDFGSVDAFRERFRNAAMSLFGSGWTWLVVEAGALKVTQTFNADTPMKHGQQALLTLDVWEHAYYVDYRNARRKFVDAFIDRLANWEFAATGLIDHLSRGPMARRQTAGLTS